MSPEEMAIEKQCDAERYLDLHTDVSERLMYEGEQNFLCEIDFAFVNSFVIQCFCVYQTTI